MLKLRKFLAATVVATPPIRGVGGRLRGNTKSSGGARSQSKLTTGHADGFTPEAGPKMADVGDEAGSSAFTAKTFESKRKTSSKKTKKKKECHDVCYRSKGLAFDTKDKSWKGNLKWGGLDESICDTEVAANFNFKFAFFA